MKKYLTLLEKKRIIQIKCLKRIMTFQSKLIADFKKQGYIVLKHIRLNKNGFPDLQILKNGISIFIEVKEGKDTLKPLQKYQIDRLINQGFEAYCLHETKGKIYPL